MFSLGIALCKLLFYSIPLARAKNMNQFEGKNMIVIYMVQKKYRN